MQIFKIACALLLMCLSSQAAEPLIVAHRGASKEAPENTIPAFKLAWEQGADAIEGDFYLTSDGHIVCLHDKDTERTAGKKMDVKKSTLAELRKLDVGAYRGEKFKGTVIPTIAEVFATVPASKKIYIEVKCGPEIIPKLLEEISKSGLKDEQIVMIAFKAEVVREFKAKAPQFQANWLVSLRKDKSGKVTPTRGKILKTLKETQADGLGASKKNAREALVKEVMNAGFAYHVWTVDDVKTAQRFKEWGVASITTNVPEFLRAGLSE